MFMIKIQKKFLECFERFTKTHNNMMKMIIFNNHFNMMARSWHKDIKWRWWYERAFTAQMQFLKFFVYIKMLPKILFFLNFLSEDTMLRIFKTYRSFLFCVLATNAFQIYRHTGQLPREHLRNNTYFKAKLFKKIMSFSPPLIICLLIIDSRMVKVGLITTRK